MKGMLNLELGRRTQSSGLTLPNNTRSLDQHRSRNAPSLAHEYVVGAAHRPDVHHLQSNTRLGKRVRQRRVRKTQPVTTAKQHDFHRMRCDPAEVGFGERFEVKPGPRRWVDLVAGEEQTPIVARAVDEDMVFAVAGE